MLEIIKGSRDYLEAAYFLSQVALFVVAIAAARFAYNQVKTAGNLELVKLLQEPRIQAARTRVILDLADKSFEEWNGDDWAAARDVAASYDIAGLLLQRRFALRQMFIPSYASSIQKCYQILEPYRKEILKRTNGDEGYFRGFDWLNAKAEKIHLLPPPKPPVTSEETAR